MLNWPLIWDQVEDWSQEQQKPKECGQCGLAHKEVPEWEEQQKKIKEVVERHIGQKIQFRNIWRSFNRWLDKLERQPSCSKCYSRPASSIVSWEDQQTKIQELVEKRLCALSKS